MCRARWRRDIWRDRTPADRALRFGVALERPQLHIVLVRGLGLLLELVEGDELRGDARVGKLGVVLKRAREDLGFFPDLLIEIADLRAQFLDARMVAEKRGGLLGKLRTKLRAATHQSPLCRCAATLPAADYISRFRLAPGTSVAEWATPGNLRTAGPDVLQETGSNRSLRTVLQAGEFAADLNPELATLGLLGLCNSVIAARSLPPTSTIDDFIAEYSRIFIHGAVAEPTARKKGKQVE